LAEPAHDDEVDLAVERRPRVGIRPVNTVVDGVLVGPLALAPLERLDLAGRVPAAGGRVGFVGDDPSDGLSAMPRSI